MYGTVNTAKIFYFLKEAVRTGSSIIPVSMEEAVTTFSPVGKSAKNFTPTAPLGSGDYARFVGANSDVCVAVRKNGPVRASGYQYYLLATKCVPNGQTISDADAAALLSSFSART